MVYLGFDKSEYPGDATMQRIYDGTQFAFTGFYLAPAPARRNRSWMTHWNTLRRQGWGLIPIYLGRQPASVLNLPAEAYRNLDWAGGTADAGAARDLAMMEAIEHECVIYLDVEARGPINAAMQEYAEAWLDDMHNDGNFRAGVYCSSAYAKVLSTNRPWIFVWLCEWPAPNAPVFDANGEIVPPLINSSGYPSADSWQYVGDFVGPIRYVDEAGRNRNLRNIDINVGTLRDPSDLDPRTDKQYRQVENILAASSQVVGGDALSMSVYLDDLALFPLGTRVEITSDSVTARPPSRITIVAGVQNSSFAVNTRAVHDDTYVMIDASCRHQVYQETCQVSILAPKLKAVVTPAKMQKGETRQGSVSLKSQASAEPIRVSLRKSQGLKFPLQVEVPPGAEEATFDVTALEVGTQQCVAEWNGSVLVSTTVVEGP